MVRATGFCYTNPGSQASSVDESWLLVAIAKNTILKIGIVKVFDLFLLLNGDQAFEKESLSRVESEVRGELAQTLHDNEVLASASASAATAASMRTVVVRFADAAADAVAYYIATAGFIGVSRRTRRSDAAFGRGVRTRRSDAASDAASCVN
ncbi:hypothetical protein YC2023_084880 [Brassica napus]